MVGTASGGEAETKTALIALISKTTKRQECPLAQNTSEIEASLLLLFSFCRIFTRLQNEDREARFYHFKQSSLTVSRPLNSPDFLAKGTEISR